MLIPPACSLIIFSTPRITSLFILSNQPFNFLFHFIHYIIRRNNFYPFSKRKYPSKELPADMHAHTNCKIIFILPQQAPRTDVIPRTIVPQFCLLFHIPLIILKSDFFTFQRARLLLQSPVFPDHVDRYKCFFCQL